MVRWLGGTKENFQYYEVNIRGILKTAGNISRKTSFLRSFVYSIVIKWYLAYLCVVSKFQDSRWLWPSSVSSKNLWNKHHHDYKRFFHLCSVPMHATNFSNTVAIFFSNKYTCSICFVAFLRSAPNKTITSIIYWR